jgi:multiple sugar transport system substrate-binding protein
MKFLKDVLYNPYVSIITILFAVLLFLFYYLMTFKFRNIKEDSIVEIYYADNISPGHQLLIDNFNEINKNRIKVTPIDLPFSKFSTNERKELFTRSLRSKSKKLDVFAVDLVWVYRFAKWSEPLNDYLTDSEINQFQDFALQSCYYNNTLAALPMFSDISIMLYREDLLKKVNDHHTIINKLNSSITWEDFIALGKNFNNSENPFYTFPADNYEGLICSYYELILNRDPDFFSGDYKFDSPEAKSSLQLLVNIVNSRNISPQEVTQFRENSSYAYFVENNGVFLRGWQSMLRDTKNLQHDPKKEKYIGILPLPHLKDYEPGYIIGGWNLMLSKHSLHKTEAMEFIKFMTSKESQSILFHSGLYLPTRRDLYNDPDQIEEYPEIVQMGKLLENGIHRPFQENYTRNSDIVSYFVNMAIDEQISVDEAVEKMDDYLNNHQLIMK